MIYNSYCPDAELVEGVIILDVPNANPYIEISKGNQCHVHLVSASLS